MPESLQIFFDLLIQFTGDGGGHRPGVVPYGIAGVFWLGLLLISRLQYKREPDAHNWLLTWGFAAGLARQVFMMSMKLVEAYSLMSMDMLHVFFPPLEHALSDAAEILIASGYMLFLVKNHTVSISYLKWGVSSVIVCYLTTFYWWADFISNHPSSKFGQTWCDWMFRINASAWLLFAVIYLWRRSEGWVKSWVCLALFFFFLDDFLKLPDMATGEVYEAIYAPVRHGLALAAVPLLAYVYVRSQASEVLQAFDTMEFEIEDRTLEIRRTSSLLEDTLSRQIQFTADASHELRTPLAIILNETEWVLEKSRSASCYQNSVQICRSSAKHMSDLVTNLLELARSDEGEELQREAVDGQALCAAIVSLMQSVATGRGVTLSLDSKACRVPLWGDVVKLKQVLINFVNNAIIHSPSHSVVTVGCKDYAEGVLLWVKDQGCGIAAEEQRNVFERFYQSDKSRSNKGMGLGLAVCESIAKSHRGRISVESALGEGATFKLWLPSAKLSQL